MALFIYAHQNNEKVSSKFLQREKQTREKTRLAVVKRKIFHGCNNGELKRKGKALMPTNEVSNNTELLQNKQYYFLLHPAGTHRNSNSGFFHFMEALELLENKMSPVNNLVTSELFFYVLH